MDIRKPIIFLCAALLLLAVPLRAQDTAVLEPLLPVNGLIEPEGEQVWTFNAASGQVLSFLVKALSGDLDPVITLRSGTTTLISNDDYAYPDNADALLEAITIPRAGQYTAVVSGFGGTSGEYTLTMLPGYSTVETVEDFAADELAWETDGGELSLTGQDGQLELSLAGQRLTATAVNPGLEAPAVYFVRVNVNVMDNSGGWTAGLTARQTDTGAYLLTLNDRGEWRFEIREGDNRRILRDWTTHPAINAGATAFTLATLADGTGYDFFYNGQFFGRFADTTLPPEGTVGLLIETSGTPTSAVTVLFDDLVMTTPFLVDGERIVPQQLLGGTPTETAQELQRRGLIPAGGEMALTVNESFAESRLPGIQRIILGRGATYQDFAIGTTVNWQAQMPGLTGCGLLFRALDETNFTLAYLDQTGGYGVSRRAGESFQPGIFHEGAALEDGDHDLLVIARGDTLYYYLDRAYAGTLDDEAALGEVGVAVVNFEPISTSCRFTNTWLWRWGE